MSTTIRVSKATKEALYRYASELQRRMGRRVDLDEAIRHLLMGEAKPELLDSLFGSVPELSVEELIEERRRDEERAERRYGV